jgi:predicted dehydrogenase
VLIPTREFLSGDYGVAQKDQAIDYVWICSRPEFQFSVLKKLGKTNSKVILEKPYSDKASNYAELIHWIEDTNIQVALSQPWTFSKSWKSFKQLLDLSIDIDFEIRRTGEQAHSYINPVLDWLPHDLNLIINYLAPSELETVFISKEYGNNAVKFNLLVNETYRFSVHSGLSSNSRDAYWQTSSKKINFLDGTLSLGNGQQEIIQEFHPILDYLESLGDSDQNLVRQSLIFHSQIFSSLGM